MKLLALLVGLVSLASCGPASAPRPTVPPVAFARVGLVEWQIATTAGALVAGPVTLAVTNAGSTAHDLRIRGRRADTRTARLSPQQGATVSIDLTGEHSVELWCTLPGHRSEGMHRTLAVGT